MVFHGALSCLDHATHIHLLGGMTAPCANQAWVAVLWERQRPKILGAIPEAEDTRPALTKNSSIGEMSCRGTVQYFKIVKMDVQYWSIDRAQDRTQAAINPRNDPVSAQSAIYFWIWHDSTRPTSKTEYAAWHQKVKYFASCSRSNSERPIGKQMQKNIMKHYETAQNCEKSDSRTQDVLLQSINESHSWCQGLRFVVLSVDDQWPLSFSKHTRSCTHL